jgi:hypothetical protein
MSGIAHQPGFQEVSFFFRRFIIEPCQNAVEDLDRAATCL